MDENTDEIMFRKAQRPESSDTGHQLGRRLDDHAEEGSAALNETRHRP
jgi:hypothetical protein